MIEHRHGCTGCVHPAHLYPWCWTDADIDEAQLRASTWRIPSRPAMPPVVDHHVIPAAPLVNEPAQASPDPFNHTLDDLATGVRIGDTDTFAETGEFLVTSPEPPAQRTLLGAATRWLRGAR